MLKGYELRRCGNKIVLREMLFPSYEMKTTFIAENKIDEHIVDSSKLFVLYQNSLPFLFWEKEEGVLKKCSCRKYIIHNGIILIYDEDGWSMWSKDSEDYSDRIHLGETIFDSFLDMFILRCPDGYKLNYFENNELKSIQVQEYKPLCLDVSFFNMLGDDYLPDVLRISTDNGIKYVNIKRKKLDSYNYISRTRSKVDNSNFVYEFIFSKEPAKELIELTAYANELADMFIEKGFGFCHYCFTAREKRVPYIQVLECLRTSRDLIMKLNLSSCINIDVNVSKLKRGETGAYVIRIDNDSCFQVADDICLKMTDEGKILEIINREKGVVNKISFQKDDRINVLL